MLQWNIIFIQSASIYWISAYARHMFCILFLFCWWGHNLAKDITLCYGASAQKEMHEDSAHSDSYWEGRVKLSFSEEAFWLGLEA